MQVATMVLGRTVYARINSFYLVLSQQDTILCSLFLFFFLESRCRRQHVAPSDTEFTYRFNRYVAKMAC